MVRDAEGPAVMRAAFQAPLGETLNAPEAARRGRAALQAIAFVLVLGAIVAAILLAAPGSWKPRDLVEIRKEEGFLVRGKRLEDGDLLAALSREGDEWRDPRGIVMRDLRIRVDGSVEWERVQKAMYLGQEAAYPRFIFLDAGSGQERRLNLPVRGDWPSIQGWRRCEFEERRFFEFKRAAIGLDSCVRIRLEKASGGFACRIDSEPAVVWNGKEGEERAGSVLAQRLLAKGDAAQIVLDIGGDVPTNDAWRFFDIAAAQGVGTFLFILPDYSLRGSKP